MTFLTEAQIYAGLRYAGMAAASAGSLFVFLGAMDEQTSANALVAFHQMLDGLQAFIGGAYKLTYILGPIIAVWLTHIGVKAQSPKSQIATVQAMPEAQVTVTNPKLAEGIPGVQVVPK